MRHRGAILKYAKRIFRELLWVALVLFAVGLWQAYSYHGKMISKAVLLAPWPTLGADEQAIVRSDKLNIVYVFAPWCGVCKASAHHVNFMSGTDFHVIATALAYGSEADVRSFVESSGLSVPVILGSAKLEEAMDIGQFPTYLVIDRHGRVLTGWSGYTTSLGLWVRAKLVGLMSAFF